MQQKFLIIAIIVILIIGVGAWFFLSEPSQSTKTNPEIVARVNGQDISNADLELIEEQIAISQNLDIGTLDEETQKQFQDQALETLISNALIQQAATGLGITSTEEEVNAELEIIKGQFQEDSLYQEALLAQNISESELKSQLAQEMIFRAYFEEALDLGSILATEEEIKNLYDQEAALGGEIPPLNDVYSQIELFIIQQKQQQTISLHLEQLRAEANIEILI